MKTLFTIIALSLLAMTAEADTVTVQVPIPDGATSIELNFTVPDTPPVVEPPVVEPEPEPEPPVVVIPPSEDAVADNDGVYWIDTGVVNPKSPTRQTYWRPVTPSDPTRTVTREWPEVVPDWIPGYANFFITEDQSIAGIQSQTLTTMDIHPSHDNEAVFLGDVGSECISYINRRWPFNQGIVVMSQGNAKNPKAKICAPYPRNGEAEWSVIYGPGRHNQQAIIYTRWPFVIEGVQVDGENVSTLDFETKNVIGGDWAWRSKAGIGGRENSDITVRNINIEMAKYDADGKISNDPVVGGSGRCIYPGDGNLLVENVSFTGCHNGVQGHAGANWTFKQVTMKDCGFRGDGMAHCIYTPTTLETLVIENSNIKSYSGHVVKTRARHTTIRNTTLEEGTGNTGAGLHAVTGHPVVLEDVTFIQNPSTGNTQIILIGANNGRCEETGLLDMKNVKIIDREPRTYPRFKNLCGRTEFIDRGGNTYTGLDGVTRNLFKDGRIDLVGVQE